MSDLDGGSHGGVHGSSPAAWTTVCIIIAAAVTCGVALMVDSWWLFWAGVALAAVGAIVGKILAAAGLGVHRPTDRDRTPDRA